MRIGMTILADPQSCKTEGGSQLPEHRALTARDRDRTVEMPLGVGHGLLQHGLAHTPTSLQQVEVLQISYWPVESFWQLQAPPFGLQSGLRTSLLHWPAPQLLTHW